MKINYNKVEVALNEGNKLPRKVKKAVLGLKMNRNKLRQLLSQVEIIKPSETMYETAQIKPYLFCPHCGCRGFKGSGNMTSYPEHWERFRCIKCHSVVGYIDNSAFIHALECADNNYNPEF